VSDILKSGLAAADAETRLETEPEAPILKMFERPDWTLFRTVDGLQQKAGVPTQYLRRLVLKELADNALDAGGAIRFGLVEGRYFIEDDGPGLDGTPQEIAELFSIARPLRSSKLLRLPQRGQLGNGLRVVAGAVLVSAGTLIVITRNQRISLRPESDGTTTVVTVVNAEQPIGTRIEIDFGAALPKDSDPFAWVRQAHAVAGVGQTYQGRSSPFWYDAAQFHELLLASTAIGILINRTPSVAEMSVWRDGENDLNFEGNGLSDFTTNAPKAGSYEIIVNVTTPYCPITSDGKAPNLRPFSDVILTAAAAAMRKAQRATPKEQRVSQKDVVLDNLDGAIAAASGDGQYRFNERQIFYQLRQTVLEETGQELLIGNFKRIITDYENEHGEIPGMYREPRGSIYHPHRGDDIELGTLTVEDYERPIWTYNKLIYIEKEGFTEALKADGWPERHDCALMSSKGFTTRAARDLVDKLAEHDEPVTIFCVTDADAYGTMIYQTFQEETKARGARKIAIEKLGLEPWEAVDLGLEVETVPEGDKRRPGADYVLEHEDGDRWAEWLQTHRVELNAMTTPEFIAWLDDKMQACGVDKLIPPHHVIRRRVRHAARGQGQRRRHRAHPARSQSR
jgi:hypothetical protein